MKKTLIILGILLILIIILIVFVFYSGFVSLGSSGDNVVVFPSTAPIIEVDSTYLNQMTFEEAVTSFVTNSPLNSSFTDDQQAYFKALRSIESANYAQAELIVKNLIASSDVTVQNFAKKTFAEMLIIQQKWSELISWVESDPEVVQDSIVELEDITCAKVFSAFPREEYKIPLSPCIVNMSTLLTGQVVVEVEINGHKKKFALDTGADLTVVTDDIIDECSVEVSDIIGEAGTSTSAKVEFRPGLIREMKVGDILVKNHPVYVINGEDLEFSLLGINIINIDGIIGLPFFMKLAVKMDFVDKMITFTRPGTKINQDTNLFWLSSPLVRVLSENGIPLVFNLDTGASRTKITRKIIERLSITDARKINSKSSGAGGSEEYEALEIDSLLLQLSHNSIFFDRIRTQLNDSYGSIVSEDGLLGIDVAHDGSLFFDFTNGIIEIITPEHSIE